MYQSVIIDPGGDGLIRIVPDVNSAYHAVVDGSILIVPAGTVAFVSINGLLSDPYGPGRYEIFTGVDPFFVRLRHIMTRGDSATSVSVFYISTEKTRFMTLGTGEFPFDEKRFNLTLNAMASCSFSFSVRNPRKVLEHLIGSYSSSFTEDDLEPFIQQEVTSVFREALSRVLSELRVSEFNSRLSEIRDQIKPAISLGFGRFGLGLDSIQVTAINIPKEEKEKLNKREQQFAEGRTWTDIELDNLSRIYGGNVDTRTIAELLTGMASRGQRPPDGNGGNAGGAGAGGGTLQSLAPLLAGLAFVPQLREPFMNMVSNADLFGGVSNTTHENTSSADAPPPLPSRTRRCPSCNGNVSSSTSVCPICGHRFR